MLDERMQLPDDQIYRELITTILDSDTQPSDVTAEELKLLLEKFLASNDELDPSMFIAGWLRYAL